MEQSQIVKATDQDTIGILNQIALFVIHFYRRILAPFLPGRCRFYPSCSEYAVQCFQYYGFRSAAWKALTRILRCNPFSKGYFDPAVPETGKTETKILYQ